MFRADLKRKFVKTFVANAVFMVPSRSLIVSYHMIETIAEWLTIHADHAPFFIFGLLLLSGFSFPISEDLLVIASGVLASTVIPEQTFPIFAAVFLGSYMSDWIAYWIGRLLGTKLSKLSVFRYTFSENRRSTIKRFFHKYGLLTLFIGRLIPFGMRNSVFMAAGAGGMRFGRFLLGDGLGCLVFSSTIFFLAYRAGENYDSLQRFLSSTGYIAAIVAIGSLIAWRIWARTVQETSLHPNSSL